ncbi:MAG: GspE/PulE family protein [Gemmatimonadaceae bacterium]
MTATLGKHTASSSLHGATRLSNRLTEEYLEHFAVLPIAIRDERLIVATWLAAIDPEVEDDLHIHFGVPVELVSGEETEVRATIRRLYGADTTAQGVIAGLTSDRQVADEREIPIDDLVHLANEAPVIKLVNLLVLEALEARASDVHLEGYAGGMHVRYRIDGVLQDAPSPPRELTAAVVSRLKIMADLDIAERRIPQDGRIRLKLQDRQVDVRVATLPTLHGESVVLRLLDKESGRIGLDQLGMAPDTLAAFREVIGRPHGMVLATGPTGSGKTTSLYAAVDLIRTGREKILTVEDPVEYELAGVPQVAVNEKVGVTFANTLRALLRQDPDVMLVGEIRDAETAEIATQAALTGHLVLSTLHTNDAAGALTRLLDLGVPPYLVASTVEAILAQRLVRSVCTECREQMPATEIQGREVGQHGKHLWRGRGGAHCRGTGYRGRTGVYELLLMTDALRAEVQRRRGTEELRAIAVAGGMRTLREDALRLVSEGLTTFEEAARIS